MPVYKINNLLCHLTITVVFNQQVLTQLAVPLKEIIVGLARYNLLRIAIIPLQLTTSHLAQPPLAPTWDPNHIKETTVVMDLEENIQSLKNYEVLIFHFLKNS